MSYPQSLDRKALLLSALFIVLIVMITGGMAIYVMSDQVISDALALTAAAFSIDELYREEVDWQKLIVSGRRAMFERLDRYSAYVEREEFQSLDEELEGSYTGIGVSIVFHEEGLMIMSVREDGPASEVGLLSGDIIVSVDSVSLRELEMEQSIRLLRGQEGTTVRLEVWRLVTEELFEVEVTRRRIPFMHIPFAGFTPDDIIYIRLLDFDAGATDDLKAAIDSLVSKDSVTPRGLIIDLRGNPGGLFREGYRTADLFLEDGVFLVGTDGRSRWNDRQHYATGNDIIGGLPIACIVDRGTASSAEIVSGALQAADRALLVGDTTFGKGLVQGFVRFPDGDGLRLTISRYYFEGPVYLNDFDSTLSDTGHGLVPDYYYDVSRMNPVRRELENSLLLREFANKYQDEIILAGDSDASLEAITDRFVSYARENGFSFASGRTTVAEEMKELALSEDCLPATADLLQKIIQSSRDEDNDVLNREKQYITDRLLQIAYERKFGIYQSYRQVLIHSRPEIQYASKILLESN